MSNNLYKQLYRAIMETNPVNKCAMTVQLHDDWRQGLLKQDEQIPVEDIITPGRPPTPVLVNPRQVPRRSMVTDRGRIAMLHAFTHIEFNAINLALDAAYRFRKMPNDFVGDWLRVAFEEAGHFSLLKDYLCELGSWYGEFQAHDGLWKMAAKTRHDVLHRMAMIPRLMEARGLDVTPGMMDKFNQQGDLRAVEILQVIYKEEIGHVAIGDRWYRYCCKQRGLGVQETYRELIIQYFSGRLRGPFNRPARLAAGFKEEELNELESCL